MARESLTLEPRLSGSMVVQHLDILRTSLGPSTFEQVIQDLEPEHRIELTQTLAVGWVSFEAMEQMYIAAARHSGRTVPALHEDVVRAAVERNARTVWRVFLRLATDSALLTRAPRLFSKSYSGGHIRCVVTKPGHASMTITAWPRMREYALRGLRVGIETILTVAGRKDPQTKATAQPDGAIIEITWRV